MSVDSPPANPAGASTRRDRHKGTGTSRSQTDGADGRTGLRGRVGGLWRAARKLTADWLDRPMTSLHLVLAIFALLLGFGLLMVLSSSSVAAFRNGGSSFSVFANQATYAAVGLIFFCGAQYFPVRLMRSLSTIAVIVSLGLLVAVLIPGVGALVNGARSWIRIGGFQFQPSEIAKLALLLWMAHVLAARRSTLGSPKALLIPVLPVFGLMAVLIMFQPDLGTTVALTIVFMAVLFFAGAPRWMFAGLGVAGLAGFFYLAVSADYRLARLLSFINPEAHPDSSYQLLQSLYGLGNGGWFGVGIGQSRAKWSYLPNADSDFIFAIIGEELGLIGAGILLLLFALLAYTGLRIARRNVDPFVKIVASAATVWLVGQAAINIGYVVGLLPVTGIPLPMISAGGTSLLITMVVFGLLANFARREPQAAAALQVEGGSRIAQFLGIRHGDADGRKPAVKRRRRGAAAIAAGGVADARRSGARPDRRGRAGGRRDAGVVRDRSGAPRSGQSRTVQPPSSANRRSAPAPARSASPGQAGARSADPRTDRRRQPPGRAGTSADPGTGRRPRVAEPTAPAADPGAGRGRQGSKPNGAPAADPGAGRRRRGVEPTGAPAEHRARRRRRDGP